jgi:predicted adenine nucleotide alpha hydrolase (AANH) superfamily ATPase
MLSGLNDKLVLHVCCAVCCCGLVKTLRERFSVTLFFYNPNIHPKEEYQKRKEAVLLISKALDVDFYEAEYCPNKWLAMVMGYEAEPEGAKRCLLCFKERLNKTAEYAKKAGAGYFSTTLLASHQKNEQVISNIGQEVGQQWEVDFLNLEDLKINKKEILAQARQVSLGVVLYRQTYCGCIFSL